MRSDMPRALIRSSAWANTISRPFCAAAATLCRSTWVDRHQGTNSPDITPPIGLGISRPPDSQADPQPQKVAERWRCRLTSRRSSRGLRLRNEADMNIDRPLRGLDVATVHGPCRRRRLTGHEIAGECQHEVILVTGASERSGCHTQRQHFDRFFSIPICAIACVLRQARQQPSRTTSRIPQPERSVLKFRRTATRRPRPSLP